MKFLLNIISNDIKFQNISLSQSYRLSDNEFKRRPQSL